jgi:methionyl-tRNA formyltransferase
MNTSTTKRNVVIVGGHDQGCRILDYLIKEGICNVVLCIARQDDRGIDGIFPSLVSRSRDYDIPVLQPKNLNSTSVLSAVDRVSPDIVLSLQNNMLFSEEWIDLMAPNLGIVNIHYAPLPKYGGYWPEMWAIWNGEREFAVTIHYVEKGLDTGPIIAQKWFAIDSQETRKTLYDKSDTACYELLIETLKRLLISKVQCLTQDKRERSYYRRSIPNDGYLDLSWDHEMQDRFLRAISYPGFPGPKIRIGNQVLTTLCEDIPFYTPVCTVSNHSESKRV